MQNISTQKRQSILDISVEKTGTAENIFAIIFANGLSITDNLPENILLPDTEKEEKTAQQFANKYNTPATALTAPDAELIRYNQGIDFWTIGEDFLVK